MGLFDTFGIRDLYDIARADDDKYEQEFADELLHHFKVVFDYTPDLGEPERDGNKRAFWIQGMLFSTVGMDRLNVLSTRDTWLPIDRPRDLLVYQDDIAKEQYDRFSE